MTTRISRSKSNPFLLSEQVKDVLHSKGLSKIFNYSDYEYFKKQAKDTFNRAYAIAEMFMAENKTTKTDFNEYIF